MLVDVDVQAVVPPPPPVPLQVLSLVLSIQYSYEMALVLSAQSKVGLVTWPVALFAGETLLKLLGGSAALWTMGKYTFIVFTTVNEAQAPPLA